MAAHHDPDASREVGLLLRGAVVTQVVAAAVRLRIPDHLDAGPVPVARLAELTGVPAGELVRLLRALEGLGLVTEEAGGHRGTPLAAPLRRAGGRMAGQALLAGGAYYEAWADLDVALRTGRSAFAHRHGRSLWTLFDEDGEVAEAFTRTMRRNSEHFLADILDLGDFPEAGVVADLGAGDGTLLAAVLRHRPGVRGIALEQPAVAGHTRRTLVEHGVADRAEVVAGDLLAGVPPGADVYVLKAVLHNWDDEHALRILGRCRSAAGPGARLLVAENAPAPGGDLLGAALRDLTMLVLFGGRDRTPDGYADLLRRAGFAVRRTVTGATGICLLDAVPADR